MYFCTKFVFPSTLEVKKKYKMPSRFSTSIHMILILCDVKCYLIVSKLRFKDLSLIRKVLGIIMKDEHTSQKVSIQQKRVFMYIHDQSLHELPRY